MQVFFLLTEEKVYTKSFISKINYAYGMWACHYCKYSKFSTMQCRKCKSVLIDVEVGILPTSLATMKDMVRLYQKYASIFQCLHVKKIVFFKYLFSKYPLKLLNTKVSRFTKNPHQTCLICEYEHLSSKKLCHFSVKTVSYKCHSKLYPDLHLPKSTLHSLHIIHSK